MREDETKGGGRMLRSKRTKTDEVKPIGESTSAFFPGKKKNGASRNSAV